MTDNYEVYTPDAAPDAAGSTRPPEAPWQVAIEFSNSGEAKPPTLVQVGGDQFPDRGQALAAAQEAAFQYRPPDPFSPQGRSVFRDGPDGFLVVIQGAMTTFHMSVRIVQHVGNA